MPRKTSTTRSNHQGKKARTKRNIEFVMPEKVAAPVAEQELHGAPKSKAHMSSSPTSTAVLEKVEESTAVKAESKAVSASTRLAARRQSAQKARHRGVGSFMTLEDYSYIKRDLITIILLSLIMMTIIIVLYFIIGG
jgi:hypothetical protein